MNYVIAARYNEKGEQIYEHEKEKLVLDSQIAREIVAGLNMAISDIDETVRSKEEGNI